MNLGERESLCYATLKSPYKFTSVVLLAFVSYMLQLYYVDSLCFGTWHDSAFKLNLQPSFVVGLLSAFFCFIFPLFSFITIQLWFFVWSQMFMVKFNFVSFAFTQMNREKLMKMAGSVRTGGKGTVRRYIHTFSQGFQLNERQFFYYIVNNIF